LPDRITDDADRLAAPELEVDVLEDHDRRLAFGSRGP
jgi:hypothetical protein